jgi:outer membrane biosynthesis protein TonB
MKLNLNLIAAGLRMIADGIEGRDIAVAQPETRSVPVPEVEVPKPKAERPRAEKPKAEPVVETKPAPAPEPKQKRTEPELLDVTEDMLRARFTRAMATNRAAMAGMLRDYGVFKLTTIPKEKWNEVYTRINSIMGWEEE